MFVGNKVYIKGERKGDLIERKRARDRDCFDGIRLCPEAISVAAIVIGSTECHR